jgi:hypothetical protein
VSMKCEASVKIANRVCLSPTITQFSPVHRRRPLPSSPAHRCSQIVSSLHRVAPPASDCLIRRRARSWPSPGGRMHTRYRAAATGSHAAQVWLGTPGSIQGSGLDPAHHSFPIPPRRLRLFRHTHSHRHQRRVPNELLRPLTSTKSTVIWVCCHARTCLPTSLSSLQVSRLVGIYADPENLLCLPPPFLLIYRGAIGIQRNSWSKCPVQGEPCHFVETPNHFLACIWWSIFPWMLKFDMFESILSISVVK